MKCTDGMFLRITRDISKEYNEIEFEDMIVDAMCMKLVQYPENYDVLVLPNFKFLNSVVMNIISCFM